MTQSSDAVESPFSKRSVQLTIACVALVASLWQTIGVIDRFGRGRDVQVRPDERWGELAGRGHPLIQIDVNQAQQGEMSLLPGVGPVLAKRIIQYRRQHGPFESVDQLGRVEGIGSRTLQGIRELAYVETERNRVVAANVHDPSVAESNQ